MGQHRLRGATEQPPGKGIGRRASDHDKVGLVGTCLLEDSLTRIALNHHRRLHLKCGGEAGLKRSKGAAEFLNLAVMLLLPGLGDGGRVRIAGPFLKPVGQRL